MANSKNDPKVSGRELWAAARNVTEKLDVLAAVVFGDLPDSKATEVASVLNQDDDARTDWDNAEDQSRYEDLAKYEDRLGTTGSATADTARFKDSKVENKAKANA